MSPLTRALSFAAAALLVLTACGSSATASPPRTVTVRFQQSSCPFKVTGGAFSSGDIRCGYVVMPERHEKRKTQPVKLAVAVFKSPSHNPAPDPLVYLEGGPGSPLVGVTGPTVVENGMPDYVGNRDLILVDQRGAGLSRPSLACGGDEALHDCHDRLLHAGIDLAAYNTVESAADIAALGPALGYTTVDLFGNSYGTTLALQVMRDHPAGIRAVVMDGITGPTFNAYDDFNANIWLGLRQVFADCAASLTCRALHPHLQGTFTRLLARLRDHPATVEGYSTNAGQDVSATMDGLGLWVTMREIIGDPTGPPLVPQIIDQFAAGDYHIAVQFVGNTLSEGPGTTESRGMHYSIECSGEPRGIAQATIAAHSQMIPESIRSDAIENMASGWEDCDTWQVPSIPTVNHTYFRSPIPTLLLPGRYDPKTPPRFARALAPKLGHAFLVPIPTLSHLVVGYDPCPDSITSAFLAQPNRKPDTGCVSLMAMGWQ